MVRETVNGLSSSRTFTLTTNAKAVATVARIIIQNQSIGGSLNKSISIFPLKANQMVIPTAPAIISTKLIRYGLSFWINFPLMVVKKEASNAEVSARAIPILYSVSKLKIRSNPLTTNTPKKISYLSILRLKNIGSKMAVKREDALRHAKVNDTLDCFMASKNVIQCAAIINPTKLYVSAFSERFFLIFGVE